MPFRTYRVGGNFISVDLSETLPPTDFDESWDITEDEYMELVAHGVPEVTEDNTPVINEAEYPQPEE